MNKNRKSSHLGSRLMEEQLMRNRALKRKAKHWEKGFKDGYYCAVANILRTHGDDVVARDVMNGMGSPNRKDINPEDWDVLAKHGLIHAANSTKTPES